MKLHAMCCGRLTGSLGGMLEGGAGEITFPVPAYLIEHPKGSVLFDSGLHPDCQRDVAARVGARLAGLFRFDFKPGEEVSAQLQARGRDPGRVDYLITSHLHFDHVGGHALIPNATQIVQRREWEAGRNADIAAAHGFNHRDFDLGHPLKQIDGEYDVFGDGRIVCIPTYGHTPGHQSLKVRLDSGDVVLTADACYFCRSLRERRLPPRAWNRDVMLRSLDTLEALEKGGARLFYGHDPEFWATLPQAPAAIT